MQRSGRTSIIRGCCCRIGVHTQARSERSHPRGCFHTALRGVDQRLGRVGRIADTPGVAAFERCAFDMSISASLILPAGPHPKSGPTTSDHVRAPEGAASAPAACSRADLACDQRLVQMFGQTDAARTHHLPRLFVAQKELNWSSPTPPLNSPCRASSPALFSISDRNAASSSSAAARNLPGGRAGIAAVSSAEWTRSSETLHGSGSGNPIR